MTYAQQLRNEGMQQGVQTRTIEIAQKMLFKQLDRAFIAQVTGLNEEVLQALQ